MKFSANTLLLGTTLVLANAEDVSLPHQNPFPLVRNFVANQIADSVNACNGKQVIPQDSCILSSVLDTGISLLMPVNNDNYYGYGNWERKLLGSQVEEVCKMTSYLKGPVSGLLEHGAQSCQIEDTTETVQAFDKYFDECLPSWCEDTVDNLVKFAVEKLSQCTGVTLDHESCVVQTSLDLALEGILNSLNGDHDNTYYNDSFRRILEASDPSTNTDGICGLDQFDTSSIAALVGYADDICTSNGHPLSGGEDIMQAIDTLFTKDSCLGTFCQGLETMAMDMMERSESYDMGVLASDYLFSCTNVEMNPNSCLEATFANKIATFVNENMGEESDPVENTAIGRRKNRRQLTRKERRRLVSSTKAPSSTKVPSSTKAPGTSTKAPSSTKAPYSSKAPSSTKAPSSSKAPKSTKAPYYPRDEYYQSQCALKNLDLDLYLEESLQECPNVPSSERDAMIQKVEIFKASGFRCIDHACSMETPFLLLFSKELEQCLGEPLPDSLLYPVEVIDTSGLDKKLACMLEYSMSSEFGTGVTEEEMCLPPLFDKGLQVCQSIIGPAASASCGVQEGEKKDVITELCLLLESFSTEEGQECLKPLCPLKSKSFHTDAPSARPSSSFTSAPTLTPTTSSSGSKVRVVGYSIAFGYLGFALLF